ncbi:hypothetical protein [Methylosinus sp. R-45379]|uniref:hypothetical protein n=1 Tax=Methylosinus sp. R-45379 TaxID=980563 RepID=UPI000A64A76C|nr:hypothetical protein [Methylosinus sp. R-45379]
MPLKDGDPGPDGDVWFRIITQDNHIRKGRIHHSAFGGKAISAPDPTKRRPWERELSGRLRSRAGSVLQIEDHANLFCKKATAAGGGTKTFSGVMYAPVADLKKIYLDTLTTGVNFTPNDDDPAHSDLTFQGWVKDEEQEREQFILWLTDNVHGLHQTQLFSLPDAQVSGFALFGQLISRLRIRICSALAAYLGRLQQKGEV